MALLNRSQILSAPIATKDVDIAEWGGTVRVRSLSARSRTFLLDAIYANEAAVQAYKADQARDEADREGIARVDHYDQSILSVLFSVVDEDNEALFTLDDYDALRDLSYPTIVELWSAIADLDKRVPKVSVEEQKKSLGKTRNAGSYSGSRRK